MDVVHYELVKHSNLEKQSLLIVISSTDSCLMMPWRKKGLILAREEGKSFASGQCAVTYSKKDFGNDYRLGLGDLIVSGIFSRLSPFEFLFLSISATSPGSHFTSLEEVKKTLMTS